MAETSSVLEIVANQAKVDVATLTPESNLEALGLQSIDMVELVFAIEDKFDIEIPFTPSQQSSVGVTFQTVGDIIAAVERLVAEQHP